MASPRSALLCNHMHAEVLVLRGRHYIYHRVMIVWEYHPKIDHDDGIVAKAKGRKEKKTTDFKPTEDRSLQSDRICLPFFRHLLT